MPLLRIIAALLFTFGFALTGDADARKPSREIPEVPPIDTPQFMGAWRVIAHIPYFAERGHVASSYEYTLQQDGNISVRYIYREGFDEPQKTLGATASVKEGTGNREWTTWYFHAVPSRFRILDVAPDYSWALVDYPRRNLAWVLARDAEMDEHQYRELLGRLHEYGINTDKLRRIPQRPEQVGKLGFATPRKK